MGASVWVHSCDFVWLQLLVAASMTTGTMPMTTSRITQPAPVPFSSWQLVSL